MTPLLQQILSGLNQSEQQELQNAIDYLAEHANGDVPEGSISRVINGLSPRVRHQFVILSEMLDTPRAAPFQPKMGNDEYAQALEADPQMLASIKGRMDADAVAEGLQRRLGTDASAQYEQSEQPLSRREQVAAAIKLHGGA